MSSHIRKEVVFLNNLTKGWLDAPCSDHSMKTEVFNLN
jgi:hypothetical protein